MKKNILLLISLFLIGLLSYSQNSNKAIRSFKQETNANIQFRGNIKTPSSISFPVNSPLH